MLSVRPGWGDELLDAKRGGLLLTDEMIGAAAGLVETWLPGFDGSVVCVPNHDPTRTLVPDFAGRIADVLVIGNSAQQLRNVTGVFEVRGVAPPGPILLIDDVSDSRWTMTVVGELLTAAGCGPVYPFAVANTKG